MGKEWRDSVSISAEPAFVGSETMFEETLGKDYDPTWSSQSCFCIQKWPHNPDQTEQTRRAALYEHHHAGPLENKTSQADVWKRFSTFPHTASNFRKGQIDSSLTFLAATSQKKGFMAT